MHTLTILWRTFYLFLLLILSYQGSAQSDTINWINTNAHALRTTSPANNDLRFLSQTLKDKTILGLGEASHGTQEFYQQKRRIIQYLISREQYWLIAFELPAVSLEPINAYVQTGKGTLKDLLQPLALYNTPEVYQLCQWIRSFNQSHLPHQRVKIVGFDHSDYWSDPLTRDEKMVKDFIRIQKQGQPKSILWAHNLHLAKDTTMAQYKAMGFYLHKEYDSQYYAIGFDTYKGSVSVLSEGKFESHDFTGSPHTFSALFQAARYPAFFVDFRIKNNPLLGTRNLITNLYSKWQQPTPLPIVAGVDFDGLIFIRNTTAARAYGDE